MKAHTTTYKSTKQQQQQHNYYSKTNDTIIKYKKVLCVCSSIYSIFFIYSFFFWCRARASVCSRCNVKEFRVKFDFCHRDALELAIVGVVVAVFSSPFVYEFRKSGFVRVSLSLFLFHQFFPLSYHSISHRIAFATREKISIKCL